MSGGTIVLGIKRQDGLDPEAKRRAWSLLKVEVLATLGAFAIEPRPGTIGSVFGIGAGFELSSSMEPAIIASPAGREAGAALFRLSDDILAKLSALAARRPDLLERPKGCFTP